MIGLVPSKPDSNPFDDPALAVSYEAWYETEGYVADLAERDLLGWLLSGFVGARTVLEIGTGTGHFARWLSGLGWHVIGVDTSAPMLAEAVRRSGVVYLRVDANALPFAARAFDAVLIIRRWNSFLTRCLRCARRHGSRDRGLCWA